MALKGRLRDFSLAQLLNLVHLARKSGTLAVSASEARAQLFFHEGKLVYAMRDGEPSELADLMVRAGKIKAKDAAAIKNSDRVKSDRQLGLLLINAGKADRKEILQALRRHMLEVVHTLFEWEDGAFVFDQKGTPPAGRITIPIGLESIVLEGGKKREARRDLQSELPSLDVVLKFTEGKGKNLRDVQLSVDEWRVISFVNPHNTVKTIAQYNEMSDLQVRTIVTKLMRDDLIEVVGGANGNGGAAPPPPSGAESGSRPLIRQIPPDRRPSPTFTEPQVEKNIISRLIDRIRRL